MTDVDLLETDVERDLRTTLRTFLQDRCDPAAVTALYDGDRSVTGPLWKGVQHEIGLAGLLGPDGGAGPLTTAREAAVTMEELGRACAPVPFLTSSVLATVSLLDGDGDLPGRIAAGERTAALVVPFTIMPGAVPPSAALGGGSTLTGRFTAVAGALDADVLLVPVAGADGVDLYAVDAADADVRPVVSLDMTRQLADVTLAATPGTLVVADAAAPIAQALQAGACLLASEQIGIARWCLETTVSYLKVRRQFARTVGGFQALKHRLADLYLEVETASAAASYAAATLALDDPDQTVAASLAQASCSGVAVRAAEEAVQLHGGIGMTWEYPVHLYLKRARADHVALGAPERHRARLAELVGLPS